MRKSRELSYSSGSDDFDNIPSEGGDKGFCCPRSWHNVCIFLRGSGLRCGETTDPVLKSAAAKPIKAGLGNAGECSMKLLDSGIRVFTLAHGTGVRWLKEELASLNVKTPLSDGCFDELVRHADGAAWQAMDATSGSTSYLSELRQQLRMQATLVHRWTYTDEKMPGEDSRAQELVRIARKYALPRPWKLSDPVAVESRRLRPSNWKWATAIETLETRSVA